MVAGAIKVRHFILGLLNQQAMSGYDIKCFLESLSWLIGSPSYGTIYPTLKSLLRDGRVSVEIVSRPDRPPRKTYSLTEKGRQELDQWLNQPAVSIPSLKAFVMRLILAIDLPHDHLMMQIEQRRDMVAEQIRSLRETASAYGGNGAGPEQRLALDYGMAIAAAELAWLDGVLDGSSSLSRESVPMSAGVEAAEE
jgi:PadR family transcriptional regulator, regulatory protein AphA